MRLVCGVQAFDVELRQGRKGVDAVVNGEPLRFALGPVRDGRCEVRLDADRLALHFARDGRTLHLFWQGVVYRLDEPRAGARAAARHDAGALEAPMPGRVSAVKVAVGQRVAKGDELLVVEAMKMENALRAPRAGVVRALHVRPGEMVAPGRALVEIGETGDEA
jgi:acetyl/propionyl-CoA carboxylase alpha subunit